ncbi:MAG: hypothetical protein ABR607_14035 [Pyrinomonadaceae bacterium]
MLGRIALVMLLSLCAAPAFNAQVPVPVLLDNVTQFGNKIINYDGDAKISATFADDVFKDAKRTSLAVDKAITAGVAASRTVTLNTGNSEKPMSLSDIKTMSGRIARVAAFSNAAQAIENASVWPKYIADGTINEELQAKGALEASKFCVAKVDEALANGVTESTAVEAGSNKMTLVEARDMCTYVRDEAQKVVDKQTAAEEAQYEPFRKLLSGDKLSVYNNRLKRYKVYGAGGRVLRTPEEYRDSSLWCTSGVNRDGIVPVWSVDCWRFQGMTKTGSVTTRSGDGDEAPSSAFR